jgi:hypothetical protein
MLWCWVVGGGTMEEGRKKGNMGTTRFGAGTFWRAAMYLRAVTDEARKEMLVSLDRELAI